MSGPLPSDGHVPVPLGSDAKRKPKMASKEYLEEFLSAVKAHCPGWVYAVAHSIARPKSGGRAAHRVDFPDGLHKVALAAMSSEHAEKFDDEELRSVWSQMKAWKKSYDKQPTDQGNPWFTAAMGHVENELDKRGLKVDKGYVDISGDRNPLVLFVAASPGRVEFARREATAGDSAEVFKAKYLDSLGIDTDTSAMMYLVPVLCTSDDGRVREPNENEIAEWKAWRDQTIIKSGAKIVVALGQVAKSVLDKRADFVLPHPNVVMKSDSGEVARKAKKIREAILKAVWTGAHVRKDAPELMRQDPGDRITREGNEEQFVHNDYPTGNIAGQFEKTGGAPPPKEKKGKRVIQTLLFDKDKFSPEQARKWIKDSDKFTSSNGMDEKENVMRFRQYEPSGFDEKTFRTIRLKDGVQAVIGVAKAGGPFDFEMEGGDDTPPPAPKVKIRKALASKKIVYGVVADPYTKFAVGTDGHADYMSPKAVEEMAHDYIQKSRAFSIEHQHAANAVPVESSVEPYPSKEDYEKAMLGLPHKVYRRKFGDDVVHSGAWILGAKLGNDEWEKYQKGEVNNFSPTGVGIRTPMHDAQVPKVEILDLLPQQVTV